VELPSFVFSNYSGYLTHEAFSSFFFKPSNKHFMKNVFFASMLCMLLLVACKQTEEKTETTAAVQAAMPEFAYTINHPADNWTPGSLEHVATVLKGLKAWEINDIDGSMASFADSVLVEFDGYEAKLGKDSLKAFMTGGRGQYKNVQIKMSDWESVISKDKKDEFVSLWYKQITTDLNGKVDSVEIMNDVKIENGKVVSLNEKMRRYGVK
jgi:hypothetical protein